MSDDLDDLDGDLDDVFADEDIDGPDGVRTFSIAELAEEINEVLADHFDEGLWVWGEVSGMNFKNPHTYFTLVDADSRGRKVQVSVNLWGTELNKLRPTLMKSGLELANGLKIRIFGNLDYYGGFGKLSLIMRGIDPNYTLGDIALQREELIRKLKQTGAYGRNREVDLNPVPLRLGLVGSKDTAGITDFRKQIEESGIGFDIKLANVTVQGDTAPAAISSAIRAFGRRDDIDVIVVVRGGGSKTDLSTFDDEAIAMAIADSPLPVFTGIGHDVDFHVADEVAFAHYKTPTACAVALIEYVESYVDAVEGAWSDIASRAGQLLDESGHTLSKVAREIAVHTRTAVDRADERLGDRVDRLRRRAPQLLAERTLAIDNLEKRVGLLDPVNVLARGWSITRTTDGRVVRSVDDVKVGDEIVTTLRDGSTSATVVDKRTSPTDESS
ncbi:MAG: exodeoxyribonuclease VII large subunit [Ilumatobacteraceae bacterium]|jgi:exodeoxyribonuclease VII large subunit|nr:exodeoxyribonuclease VII large subunit [Ilumatobacteraceae bacterium]